MTKPTHTTEAVKEAMEHLIDRATNFDIEALETIYHHYCPASKRQGLTV